MNLLENSLGKEINGERDRFSLFNYSNKSRDENGIRYVLGKMKTSQEGSPLEKERPYNKNIQLSGIQ